VRTRPGFIEVDAAARNLLVFALSSLLLAHWLPPLESNEFIRVTADNSRTVSRIVGADLNCALIRVPTRRLFTHSLGRETDFFPSRCQRA